MRRVLIFVFLISHVNLEMSAVHYLHMARNTRSNSQPVQTGYMYSKHNDEPPIITTVNVEPTFTGKLPNKIKIDDKIEKVLDGYSTIDNRTHGNKNRPYISLTEYDKSKLKLWEGKKKSLSKPVEEESMLSEIVRSVDEEDTRTDTRNPYDGWPYSYHSSYDYEPHKYNTEYEKAKDKHYFMEGFKKVIPVYEEIREDYPNHDVYTTSHSKYKKKKPSENPVLGDQPFFSFVLNDYFDKTDEEDPLTLKGIPWGGDFDNEIAFHDSESYGPRTRRLKDNSNLVENNNIRSGYDTLKDTEHLKKYDNENEVTSSEKGDELKNSINAKSKYNSEKYEGFKDFVDSFANKFGSEGQNKNSKYLLQTNADKGEKKKGFRKVYHKDEYQEDNEFYDNTNKKAASEEKGGTHLNKGGSEAYLRSHAAAALANEHDVMDSNKDYYSNKFHKNNEANNRANGYNNEIDYFRNVAKHAALSNNADYVDHFVK